MVLILTGILILCLLAAGQMSRSRNQSLIEGQDIIEQIRQGRLKSFWKQQSYKQWFLIQQAGKPIGWRFRYRKGDSQGGFEGHEILVNKTKQGLRRAESRWALNDRAEVGAYVSSEHILGKVGRIQAVRSISKTRIEMNSGQLTVKQQIGGSNSIKSSAEEPPAYVPEGSLELAMFLAAKRETTSRFRMIIDSQPPQDKKPVFSIITVSESGVKASSPGGVVAKTDGPGPDSEQLYFFDKSGRLEKKYYGDTEEISASREQIIAAFKREPAMLRNFPK